MLAGYRYLACLTALMAAPWISSPHRAVAEDLASRTKPGSQTQPGSEEECNLELEASSADSEIPNKNKPLRFEPSKGRDCHRYRGRFVCEGPRRVPIASDAAAKAQVELGLIDSKKVGAKLLLGAPESAWVRVAPRDDALNLTLPIDDGIVWRGPGRRGRGHKGVDLGAQEGTPIRSVRAGVVVYSDNTLRGYGNLVGVVHSDGTVAFYAHNLENHVAAGEQVRRGQVIGRVGHTGLARGSHLHFELRKSGRATNPIGAFRPQPTFR